MELVMRGRTRSMEQLRSGQLSSEVVGGCCKSSWTLEGNNDSFCASATGSEVAGEVSRGRAENAVFRAIPLRRDALECMRCQKTTKSSAVLYHLCRTERAPTVGINMFNSEAVAFPINSSVYVKLDWDWDWSEQV